MKTRGLSHFVPSGYLGMKQQEANIPAFHVIRLSKALGRILKCYDQWGNHPEALAKWRAEKTTIDGKTSVN